MLGRLARSFWVQLVIVVVVTGTASFVGVGARGLAASEGHRVVPGVEYIERWESGERGISLLVPTLFDTPYLRKPPGVPWAIALSMSVFGQNELGARIPSALSAVLMAALGAWCGHRWWGRHCEGDGASRFSFGALACGFGVGLMPAAFSSARAAEIEMPHNLMTMIAAVSVIELLVVCARSRARLGWAVGLGLGLAGMVLTKGPAGAPVVVGAVAGCAIATRRWRALIDPFLLGGLGLGLACVGVWVWLTAAAVDRLDSPPVMQSVGAFLFEDVWGVAKLPFEAFAYHMTASVALVFALSPRSRVDMAPGEHVSVELGRALGWAWVVAVGVFTLSGVTNPRYVLPAASLAGLASGFVIRGVVARGFVGPRLLLGRVVVLGSPWVMLGALFVFVGVYLGVEEPRRSGLSGRAAGVELGAVLSEIPGEVEVWADGAIEARPEVLWEAEREAARRGAVVRGRWAAEWKEVMAMPASEAGVFRVVMLRVDDGGNEVAECAEGALLDGWREVWRGDVAQFRFWLGMPGEVGARE